VYYDAEDNETYLVLRIMTLDNRPQTGIWIRASSPFNDNSKGQANMRIQKHNVDMFSQWFDNDKTIAESIHPILKEIWCRYLFEQYKPECYHCYLDKGVGESSFQLIWLGLALDPP
jgi:hypothetical protein